MTLSTVFRIQALVFALFGVLMLLMPTSMMESFGVESSATMAGVLQNMSVMVLAMAYLSWQMPNWVGDNLKTVGMVYAILHVAFMVIRFIICLLVCFHSMQQTSEAHCLTRC